ncbi:MAG: neutral zinc metallopeptidase [Candidatus Nanopelagicales bacterium]
MKFDDDKVDLSGVDDQRDGRGASPTGGIGPGQVAMAGGLSKMLGGGAGLTIVILLVLAMCSFAGSDGSAPSGGDAGLFQVPGSARGVDGSLAERCPQDAADGSFEDTDCLLVKSYNEANEVWDGVFTQAGQQLTTPRLAFFDGATRTACGPADTNVGPFYCPGDQRIYFDLGFTRQLESLGVNGQYAMVYIMAHEYGHHLQNVLGIERQVRRAQQADRRSANNYSVGMELQADCLAGVWGRLANDMGNVQITPEEFRQASSAAAAVGDDRIMQQAGGQVNPERFTHGSAKQREYWYTRGYNTGDINQCDTFKELGLPL